MRGLLTRKRARRTAAALVALASSLCFAAVALGLPPFTTAPKTASGSGGQAELFGAAVGCHSGYDRFVLRGRLATPGYDVRYVNKIVADGSGKTIVLLGTKRIRVIVRPARGHTNAGTNLLPSTLTPKCSNLRQVKKAGDFEGVVTYGLGLSRRTGFRVFRLTGPTRVVVDVAH
jgi:hypothetical protein